MESFLASVNAIVWGIPVLMLILLTGILLSIKSGFAQLQLLPSAIRYFIISLKKDKEKTGGISGYRALCTALAATVGTGNIAGVAGAIAIGGPGVIFWMWVCAILGMATKFAEVTLSVYYRHKVGENEYIGGPMYIIEKGLSGKYRLLSHIYCFFGVVAALGIGNAVQVNAIIDGVKSIAILMDTEFRLSYKLALGIVLSAMIIPIFRKGISGIGRIAEKLVPFASVAYISLCMIVLLLRFRQIPAAFLSIIQGAFSPAAVTGGIISSFFLTLRVGASRGVFTNEAGMGTASIAHAVSNVSHPTEQGLMGIMEVFLDTIVICTLTAFVILCSGISIPYGSNPGIILSLDAFSYVFGNWVRILLVLLTCIFAFATIMGWGLYGASCCQYLFGNHAWNRFVYVQATAVVFGSVMNTSSVWILAEIVNGLMAIPNLIAIALLSGVFNKVITDYRKKENAYRL